MKPVRTHYENLKVARNAPPEVIRAAYKSLSQKFHPDRNPGNTEAARIMTFINTAYEVLSDPVKRKKHDQWIAKKELEAAAQITYENRPRPMQPQPHVPPIQTNTAGNVAAHIIKNWALYCIAGFAIWIFVSNNSRQLSSGPKPDHGTPPARVKYVRPNNAPNGYPWPAYADYINGYQQLNTGGLSSVTVDNSKNDSDVFVKLVLLDGAKFYPVRQIYIPAYGSFALNNVAPGAYDIRYRDLGNGGLSRSEIFRLDETSSYDGTQYSNITMTLYKVQNGNMQTYGLSEAEF